MLFHTFCIFFSSKLLPLLYALIGFELLITIHELGHFLFCKIFGIHTPTFSIGFGPEIFKKKIGNTNFRIAIIPLGGYVEISGLAEIGQGSQEHAEQKGSDSFGVKPYWQKFFVLSGGILFNLIFAYGVFVTLFMAGTDTKNIGVTVAAIVKDSAAEKFNIHPGDQITAINKTSLQDEEQNLLPQARQILWSEIRKHPGEKVKLHLIRDNKKIVKRLKIGVLQDGSTQVGSLGAMLQAPIPRLPFMQAICEGIKLTNQWICDIARSVKYLITQRTLEGAGGPVMILSQSFTSAQNGLMALLAFLAIISINLALMNILPIGALDGGQLLFVTIEAIIRRRIPDSVKLAINLASWALFIGLALYLTYKDIITIFGDSLSKLFASIMTLVK